MAEETRKPGEGARKAAKEPPRQPKYTAEELKALGLDPACYGYGREKK